MIKKIQYLKNKANKLKNGTKKEEQHTIPQINTANQMNTLTMNFREKQ